tara:strand:- start:272 stop:685 length:414 start_codon:yes stop_codon:yes gene_type:complete
MAVTVKCDQYSTVVLSGDDEIKYLNVKGSSGNTISAYDVTNTQYVVPVGKKLILTSLYLISGNVGGVEYRFYHGSTINSTAGATEWIDDAIRYETGSTSNLILQLPIYVEVPAGDYVTVNFANEEGSLGFMGVLTDA